MTSVAFQMAFHLDEEQCEAVLMCNEMKQPIILESSETLLIEPFSVGTREETGTSFRSHEHDEFHVWKWQRSHPYNIGA
jgi:hypothetical protein